ncbi:MAG: DNA mismatch repair endonuclease MutL, partial [Chitinivibrionales bacterium]
MTSDSDRIHILPQVVTDKIAAGEVIERPASVIKELVENAIDAGADRIEVTVNDGGFSLIRVTDNGSGMSEQDLSRCTIRHATSKIRHIEDLFTIATLGFRGEALASIGSVSRMKVTSSATGEGLGSELSCEGGILSDIIPVAHMQGTSIECRDLFYNVPARKKFMKSQKAERMAVMRLMEQMVVPYPAIHFTVTCDGRRLLDVPRVETTLMRIAQVAGSEFAKKLITCSAEGQGMDALLYICAPHDATPRPRFQNLYVNLRRIDCDSITYGIREAFSRFITSHFKPAWFCFLDVDPHHIDVNVHPTKQRVKFDDDRRLFSFVFHMVERGLTDDIQQDVSTIGGEMAHPSTQVSERPNFSIARDSQPSDQKPSGPSPGEDTPGPLPHDRSDKKRGQTALSFFSVVHSEKKDVADAGEKGVQLSQEQWDLIPCYQIHKMYILAPIKKGILLIDQHAAHERVLFQKFQQSG